MIRILTAAAVLAMLTFSAVGCHASGDFGNGGAGAGISVGG